MAKMTKRPRKRKSSFPLRSRQTQRRNPGPWMDKQLSIVLLFVATLILLGFVIHWKSDSPAFYTFLSATLAYVFGRRLAS